MGLHVKPDSWHLAYGTGSLLHHSFIRSFIHLDIHEAPTACLPGAVPGTEEPEPDKHSVHGGQTEATDHLSAHQDCGKLFEDKFRALWSQV